MMSTKSLMASKLYISWSWFVCFKNKIV